MIKQRKRLDRQRTRVSGAKEWKNNTNQINNTLRKKILKSIVSRININYNHTLIF